MGKIVFINQDAAVQKAAAETIRFYESMKRQLSDFEELIFTKYTEGGLYSDLNKLMEIPHREASLLEYQKNDILNELKSEVRKYAEALCQSPDIDLVLDASAVIMGDSDNDMTEQFCNYLVEHNPNGLLSLDNKQAVVNSVEKRINSNWVFRHGGLEFKAVIE
jgi:hypothetical protein